MAKLRQKISGGFRSERGAYNFARMRAVIATARKQGWNVIQTLVHPDPIQLIPLNSPLKKALLTGFHSTAKHNATKAVSPSSETMRTI